MQRFFRLLPLHFALIFAITLMICLWADGAPYHIIFWFFGDTVFAFLVGLTIVTEVMNTYIRQLDHDKRWALGAVGALFLAFFIWNITKTGTSLCDPYSPVQGHAIWHILDAVSTFCLFRYYVSEHRDADAVTA
jgi:hypothetical protein